MRKRNTAENSLAPTFGSTLGSSLASSDVNRNWILEAERLVTDFHSRRKRNWKAFRWRPMAEARRKSDRPSVGLPLHPEAISIRQLTCQNRRRSNKTNFCEAARGMLNSCMRNLTSRPPPWWLEIDAKSTMTFLCDTGKPTSLQLHKE